LSNDEKLRRDVISKILEGDKPITTKNIINILKSINISADGPTVVSDREFLKRSEMTDDNNLPEDEWLGRNDADRRENLIMQILENTWISAREITGILAADPRISKVTVRTVQRNLEILDGSRGVTANKATAPYLWRRKTGESIALTDENTRKHELALAIMTAKKQLELTAPPGITEALKEVFNDAELLLNQTNKPASLFHKRVKVINPSHLLQPPRLDEKVLMNIREAALFNRVIKFGYKKHPHDAAKVIIATGLGLYYRGSVAYFISFNHESKEVVRYPVSRIEAAIESIGIAPQGVNNFDIEQYEIENSLAYTYDKPFRLKAMIFLSIQREIEDAHLGENQSVTPIEGNETFKLLEVDVPYTLDLVQWLIARAPYLKILEPAPFEAKFKEEIKRAFENTKNKEPHVPKNKNFVNKKSINKK
jgi:predicted DNA-binding transcriptional regulator YafY